MPSDMDLEMAAGILAELIVEIDGTLVLLDCLTEKHGDNAVLVDSNYVTMRLLRSFVERIACVISDLQTYQEHPAPQ